ncbi:MAG TPA: uroporphyrinogen-III C-methyltransferase [Dehalococcoidia bacterium]|nr:uroporphyrinogen-III C-methyltransferase [Dehalococcoidia bacterium]
MSRGFVSLVGAGPGDPGLLTLAGRDRLANADVVIYDRLVNPEILEHVRQGAELVFAGKSPAGHTLTQEQINDLLVQKAREGKRVVRLKGGDPFVFGRGGEEGLALAAAGVAFEVVPGVTSAVAVPAYAGVPVTHRGLASSFAVVTGHEDDSKQEESVDWERLATAVDTLVVLMGGSALASTASRLIAAGRDPETPAISVQWGTTADQRSVAAPLREIASRVRAAGLGTPLLTVIGEVGRLRESLSWFESLPLFGKTVLVTRTREQSSALSRLLRAQGARAVELPTIELVPLDDNEAWAAARALGLGDYTWCLFTSANGVEQFWRAVVGVGWDARVFKCLVAAIGRATAEALRSHSIVPDLVATESTSEGLLEALVEWAKRSGVPAMQSLQGARFLYPRAADARDVLAEGLRAQGATVDEVLLYEARVPGVPHRAALDIIRSGRVDAVTFASSSSVRNLAAMLGPDLQQLRTATVACIGPVTAATARELGFEVSVEPAEQSIAALVEALCEHYRRAGP